MAAVSYGSACYGFAAILLSIAAARRITGSRGALASGVAVWLGTPLLFYMYVAPPFSHACSAFAVALFVTIWLHVRESWTVRGLILLGLAAALMAMVREQDIFFAVGPAFDWALSLVHGSGLRVQGSGLQAETQCGGGGCLAFAIGYTPQLLAYNALNGYPRPGGARDAQDDVVCAARACRCSDRRSTDSSCGRRWRSSRSRASSCSRRAATVARGALAVCALLMIALPGICRRQRRILDRRRRVRPAAVRRGHDPARHRAGDLWSSLRGTSRRGRSRRDRRVRLVERRADGGVRHCG